MTKVRRPRDSTLGLKRDLVSYAEADMLAVDQEKG